MNHTRIGSIVPVVFWAKAFARSCESSVVLLLLPALFAVLFDAVFDALPEEPLFVATAKVGEVLRFAVATAAPVPDQLPVLFEVPLQLVEVELVIDAGFGIHERIATMPFGM